MPTLTTTLTTTSVTTTVLMASETLAIAIYAIVFAFVTIFVIMTGIWVRFTDHDPAVLARWWGLLFRSIRPPRDDEDHGP